MNAVSPTESALHKTSREEADALVDALKRHEEGAVEQLLETFGERVYRLALRISRSVQDAEEIAQDALWTAVRKIETFKGEAAFSSWLFRITANAAYQKLRARHGQEAEVRWDAFLPQFDEDGRYLEPIEDWPLSAGEKVVQGELREKLQEAIEALPVDYRTTYLLHDVEGLSNPEIAEILGISLPAVKSRIHRSRLFLRQKLASYLRSV